MQVRNPAPMLEAPRCGAKTRNGGTCKSPAVHGKARCRMHGGTNSGAPKGNKNAFKHGREYIQARSLIMQTTGLSRGEIPDDVIQAKVETLRVKRAIREVGRQP